ncbi:MAG: HAMP domain-containing histidine kinase, partial [Flavobacteriales bacterium]|nr:HAMP domain-containing histidine kinase [Flavobacteriales bacterium]
PLICNAQMMNDCFKSLLQNSIEAIKEKDMPEKEGIISIKTELLEGRIIISFTDNGTGMTEEIKEKAFDLYFTTKGAQKSGTSLTIVKSTITTHDGHVEVDTKVGKGTTIRLIIPIKKRKNK